VRSTKLLILFFFREYMPTLEEFFEEAIEQADPENMVENKYKYVSLCCVSLYFDLMF